MEINAKFQYEKIIKWKALSRTDINMSIADKSMFLKDMRLPYIPRIGEHIMIDNTIRRVEKVIYVDDINVIFMLEPTILYVDYYDYMKLFTHCLDSFKIKSDPEVSKHKWIFVKPLTFEEWESDIEILEKYQRKELITEEIAQLENRRCKIYE